MKKIFTIFITLLFFGVAGNVYGAPVGLFDDPNKTTFGTIDRDGGTYGTFNDTYKGYTSADWSGFYIGTFSGNDSETLLRALAEAYLDEVLVGVEYAKVDEPDTTSGFLTVGYEDDLLSGTWELANPYELGFYSVMGGNEFAFYYVFPYQTSGIWSTTHVLNPAGNIPGISHLSALATEGTPVPEPATMLWLGTALFGLFMVSRKKFMK